MLSGDAIPSICIISAVMDGWFGIVFVIEHKHVSVQDKFLFLYILGENFRNSCKKYSWDCDNHYVITNFEYVLEIEVINEGILIW